MLQAAGNRLGEWKDRALAARLPVRIQVPGRDELIAAGLATLAMGLVLGLAIGPGGTGPGSLLPAYAAPFAATAPIIGDDSGGSELPTLGSPAGGTQGGGGAAPTVAAAPAPVDAPAVPVATTVTPVDETPVQPAGAGGDRSPSPPPDKGDEPTPALPLTATVLGVSVTGRSYAVADDAGNLFTLFANGVPAVGDRVDTGILPLSNGTFVEAGTRKSRGQRTEAKIRGVVSFIDRGLGVMVISGRGASVPVGLETGDPSPGPALPDPDPFQVGSDVEATVEVLPTPPVGSEPESSRRLRALTAEATPNPASAIELTGVVRAVSAEARTLEVAADSDGLIDSVVTIEAPASLDLKLLRTGRAYSITVRRTSEGGLRLTGLSPAFSRKAADDRNAAFGEHA